MRFSLNKRAPGTIEFGVIYGGIVFIILIAGRFLPVLVFAPSCVFKTLTGLSCPTCGSTRCVVFLAHGNIASAFFMNPLIAAVAMAALFFLPYSLFTLVFNMPRIGVTLSENEKNQLRMLAVLLVLANWLYLVITL